MAETDGQTWQKQWRVSKLYVTQCVITHSIRYHLGSSLAPAIYTPLWLVTLYSFESTPSSARVSLSEIALTPFETSSKYPTTRSSTRTQLISSRLSLSDRTAKIERSPGSLLHSRAASSRSGGHHLTSVRQDDHLSRVHDAI